MAILVIDLVAALAGIAKTIAAILFAVFLGWLFKD